MFRVFKDVNSAVRQLVEEVCATHAPPPTASHVALLLGAEAFPLLKRAFVSLERLGGTRIEIEVLG